MIFVEGERKQDKAHQRWQSARANARYGLDCRLLESDNGNQPENRKRALEAASPPRIAGRARRVVWGDPNGALRLHYSMHWPTPQNRYVSDGEDFAK